jgi:hypothetical protein
MENACESFCSLVLMGVATKPTGLPDPFTQVAVVDAFRDAG